MDQIKGALGGSGGGSSGGGGGGQEDYMDKGNRHFYFGPRSAALSSILLFPIVC